MKPGLIEAFFAWILVIGGLVFDRPLYVVAAGLFAIAANIAQIREKMPKEKT